MTSNDPRRMSLTRPALAGLIAGILTLAPFGGASVADDTDLFRSSVAPNIMFVVDNSKSMNNTVTHPDYETDPGTGTVNKSQTQCMAFRDQSGSTFSVWNEGHKYPQIKTPDGDKVRGKLEADVASGMDYGKIYDAWGTPGLKSPTATNDPGAELYYSVSNSDQGKGRAYYYDTGEPIVDGSGNHLWQGGGIVATMETRLTPRESAANNGIDPMTLEIDGGQEICNVTVPAGGWELWGGDPAIEVPSGSTIKLKFQYLDFLFSDIGGTARAALFAPSFVNGGKRYFSSCLGLTGSDNEYEVYRRTRLIALHKILETVVCEVNEQGTARFGVAQFRYRGTGGQGNVQGGYAVLPINDFKVWDADVGDYVPNEYELHGVTASHAEHLERVINKIGPDSTTPLAETLFQVYSYFMSRDSSKLPKGRSWTGTETAYTFPLYSYDTSQPDDSDPKDLDKVGGHYVPLVDGDVDSSKVPPCPVENYCQKNFVLFITDGGSYEDTFSYDLDNYPLTDPANTGQGFDIFDDLIGDHFRADTDGTADETEWKVNNKRTSFMDDISFFMNRWDFLPDEDDFPGVQQIDTYTVGYAMESEDGGSNLERTAINGNGLYFESADSDELAADLVEAIGDMIDKAQSFTSATVPASRTADGNNFYSSYFRPEKDSPFWEGHLRAFDFTQSGDILTKHGKCALGDTAASPPCSSNGVLSVGADPFWDAHDEIPAPMARKLYMGRGNTSFLSQPPLWSAATKEDLGLLPSDLLAFPYTGAISDSLKTAIDGLAIGDDIDVELVSEAEDDLDSLATMISKHIAGCEFGTDCTSRTDGAGEISLLGDIFHSNPIVVGTPNAPINEASYKAFRTAYKTRSRLIYAGSNDGFLHAFQAGTWRTHDPDSGEALTIPQHDRGSGAEIFGFMPSWVRSTARDLPTDLSFPRRWYGIDGSPVSTDVWMYRQTSDKAVNPKLPTTEMPKSYLQWRTVLIGGLRSGGKAYYALDVTNPADASNFPGYLWDFPCDPAHCDSAVNSNTSFEAAWMGETWSDPVITRVRVKGNEDEYSGPGYERWVAIFGAGYSEFGDPNHANYQADVDASNVTQGRAIYMVDITTGKVLAKKVFTKTAASIDNAQIGFPEMRYAMPSAPAVYDLDFDGFADIVFMGDLGGNMWKWVIKEQGDDPINNGSHNKNIAQPNWPFRIFFHAPASTEPALGDAPDFSISGLMFRSFFFPPTGVLRSGNLVIAFGSGQRANVEHYEEDGSTDNNNRFYVVRDSDPFEIGGTMPDAVEGYIDESALASNSTLNSINPASSDCHDMWASYKGYVIQARDSEKFVTNSAVFLGDLITGSFMPASASNTNPCKSAGSSFVYRFTLDCGVGDYNSADDTAQADRRKAIGDGMPTRPRVSAGALVDSSKANDPCANRVVIVTSDGSVDNDCQGSATRSGNGIRSWLQR